MFCWGEIMDLDCTRIPEDQSKIHNQFSIQVIVFQTSTNVSRPDPVHRSILSEVGNFFLLLLWSNSNQAQPNQSKNNTNKQNDTKRSNGTPTQPGLYINT